MDSADRLLTARHGMDSDAQTALLPHTQDGIRQRQTGFDPFFEEQRQKVTFGG
jgi:hypothetical protein